MKVHYKLNFLIWINAYFEWKAYFVVLITQQFSGVNMFIWSGTVVRVMQVSSKLFWYIWLLAVFGIIFVRYGNWFSRLEQVENAPKFPRPSEGGNQFANGFRNLTNQLKFSGCSWLLAILVLERKVIPNTGIGINIILHEITEVCLLLIRETW